MTCCHFLPSNEVTFLVHGAKGCNPWQRKIKAAVSKTVAAADEAKTPVYSACAKISVRCLGFKPEQKRLVNLAEKASPAGLQYESRRTCWQVNTHFQNKPSVTGVMKCVSVGVEGEAARAASGSSADREAIGPPGGGVVLLAWFQMF